MLESTFSLLLRVTAVYLGLGFCAAVLFVTVWCRQFDPAAAQGTWGFRLAIFPGLVTLWPVILAKVVRVARGGQAAGEAERPVVPEALRKLHGLAFVTLAIIAPLLLAAALIWRAPGLGDVPAGDVPGVGPGVGVVTALLGGPFFFYLLKTRRARGMW